jgi:hypothetical protein
MMRYILHNLCLLLLLLITGCGSSRPDQNGIPFGITVPIENVTVNPNPLTFNGGKIDFSFPVGNHYDSSSSKLINPPKNPKFKIYERLATGTADISPKFILEGSLYYVRNPDGPNDNKDVYSGNFILPANTTAQSKTYDIFAPIVFQVSSGKFTHYPTATIILPAKNDP